MLNPNTLVACILIAIPVDASQEEVVSVIDGIKSHFKIDSVAPTALVATNATSPAAIATMVATNNGTAPTGDIDAEGLPWDERIHSSSKNKNADGTWRIKKGADKALVQRIKSEILATRNVAAPVQQTIAAPTPVAVAAPTPVAIAAPPAIAAPVLAPPAPVAPDPFVEFVNFITANTHSAANPSGRLTPEWITASLTAYGVPNGDIQNLAHNQALIATVHGAIKTALGIA